MKPQTDASGYPADVLASLYAETFGTPCTYITRLGSAGSDRRYFRLGDGERTVIGTYGADVKENRAFIGLDGCFAECGIRVPEVLAVSTDSRCYLQADLGDVSLFSQLGTEAAHDLIAESMRSLARMQTAPAGWEYYVMSRPFGRRLVKWDLNYFKYEYLKPCAIAFDEEALEDDFDALACRLCDVEDALQGFMYRDFQSRNVMIDGGKPWFIDFQGGRKGPCIYDAVSFLWQAKARFSDAFRREMLGVYADAFVKERPGLTREAVLADVDVFVLFRTLQVLGAYGFRGLVEKRAHFIESIPAALANLATLIADGCLDRMPELKRVCSLLVADKRFTAASSDGLTVTVYSFSYKQGGYPADYSGNGGGFMFDCRAMHNPGRYDEYKPLTGRDKPVIDFLEERGEVQEFLQSAWGMTDKAVARYLQRGFSSLQIGFGCTGGRHRSVYCAEQTARRIAEMFPDANVHLIHREQGIDEFIAKH